MSWRNATYFSRSKISVSPSVLIVRRGPSIVGDGGFVRAVVGERQIVIVPVVLPLALPGGGVKGWRLVGLHFEMLRQVFQKGLAVRAGDKNRVAVSPEPQRPQDGHFSGWHVGPRLNQCRQRRRYVEIPAAQDFFRAEFRGLAGLQVGLQIIRIGEDEIPNQAGGVRVLPDGLGLRVVPQLADGWMGLPGILKIRVLAELF